MTRFTRCLLHSLGLCVFLTNFAMAELPSIRFDRMQPLGVSVGGSVDVTVQGRDIEDVTELLFDHPGLSAKFVKANTFTITVADDVPAGTYDVRMSGRYGVSNPRQFLVTHGLTDVAETEPNNTPEEAQVIAINSAVNGTCDGNGQDSFRFTLKKGERVTIDCQAVKLDSEMDASLILSSASGQILAANGDYHGRDPFIDFVAAEEGDFIVVVHDLAYRGGYPYRLILSNLPEVENVFPRAVQAGTKVRLTALGRNFGGDLPDSSWLQDDLPLQAFTFEFAVPSQLANERRYEFLEHPTDHSVLPTAATCTLDGLQVRPPLGDGVLRPSCLFVTNDPITLDQEPNDDRDHVQQATLPLVLNGRFDVARDADWFEFEPTVSGNYHVEVYSERIAGRADAYVVIEDDKGNQVTELDDYGVRLSAFDGHLRDPVGNVNLQEKRKYKLLVQDRYGRGGSRYQYVLVVRQAVPDFHIAAIHSENPGPSGTNLWRGGAETLDVVIHQQDGFNGQMTITAEGLPQGVHAVPMMINSGNRGKFVLWADADAPQGNTPFRLIATAKDGDREIRREVRPYTKVWSQGNSSRPMRQFVVGVREPAPYSLRIEPANIECKAGEKVKLKLIATRSWADFRDKINVIPNSFHDYFKMGNLEIPAAQSEVAIEIDVQANARPGSYTLSVQGQAQVPYDKNPESKDRKNTLVSTPSQPVTITVMETPKP